MKTRQSKLDVNLQDGFATRVDLFLNGETKSFELSVLEKDTWHDHTVLFLGYVDFESKRYVTSFYSGGATGCGHDPNYLDNLGGEENVQVVTSDLKKVIEMVKEANQEAENEKEDYDKTQEEKAERINKLPKQLDVDGFPELVLCRSDAEYNPRYSSKIKGGGFSFKYRKNEDSIWISNFTAGDNKLLAKKFGRYHPDLCLEKEPKIVLESLVKIIEDATQMVMNA